MIKLAVFDWNGTILNDIEVTVAASQKEFAVLGREAEIDLKTLQENFEVPINGFYQKLGVTDIDITTHGAAMRHAFHDYYETHVKDTSTYNGAINLLKHLETNGVRSIILSNHHVKGIAQQLQRLGLTSYFSSILANDDIHGAMHLGKYERLKRYMTNSQYQSQDVFIIGDTAEEVIIGQELGLRTVSLVGGMSTPQRLKAAKPDVLIDSLHDLIPVLEEWK